MTMQALVPQDLRQEAIRCGPPDEFGGFLGVLPKQEIVRPPCWPRNVDNWGSRSNSAEMRGRVTGGRVWVGAEREDSRGSGGSLIYV